jgi:hypothetical protein
VGLFQQVGEQRHGRLPGVPVAVLPQVANEREGSGERLISFRRPLRVP